MSDHLNPIERYRQAQRRLRRLFAPFTAAHCPRCATPCCRKPTWVRPVDLVLVEELGYELPVIYDRSPSHILLDTLTESATEDAESACDFLTERGCAFPSDLRPFGCAAAICDPMRRELSPGELARIERAVARLRAAHEELMAFLHAPAPSAPSNSESTSESRSDP